MKALILLLAFNMMNIFNHNVEPESNGVMLSVHEIEDAGNTWKWSTQHVYLSIKGDLSNQEAIGILHQELGRILKEGLPISQIITVPPETVINKDKSIETKKI
jgi:hypothetical protein